MEQIETGENKGYPMREKLVHIHPRYCHCYRLLWRLVWSRTQEFGAIWSKKGIGLKI